MARIIGAALVSRGSHNLPQGRRFLTDHRMLVAHTLKRSAGIGHVGGADEEALAERIGELADSFVVMIIATGFLEVCMGSFLSRYPLCLFFFMLT